jgi:sugar transferase (PEP-CTERM/EpsH1 system associated)
MLFDRRRRIAQWQSASPNTEEAVRFDSCSAYHTSPQVLFLSHCVPNPPDKGDRIRAHHELIRLASRYEVHLVCFARTPDEIGAAMELRDRCASIYVEVLPRFRRTTSALTRFALGSCLTTSFFDSAAMRRRVAGLRVDVAVAYCSAMGDYAPETVPLVADMVDVDSEKWRQYSETRFPGRLYGWECMRVRQLETRIARRANCSFFSTRGELELFRSFAPGLPAAYFENGVDFTYFDPDALSPLPEMEGRPTVLFVGEMDYFPNVEAACWFARECLPLIRRLHRTAEFWIVGRNPTQAVRKLGAIPGVRVTGRVPDVRPYLRSAGAVVAPLRVARGIQNKVLEALAMAKTVFATAAVCATFDPDPPYGLVSCDTPSRFAEALDVAFSESDRVRKDVRDRARARFCWDRNVRVLVDAVAGAHGRTAALGLHS